MITNDALLERLKGFEAGQLQLEQEIEAKKRDIGLDDLQRRHFAQVAVISELKRLIEAAPAEPVADSVTEPKKRRKAQVKTDGR